MVEVFVICSDEEVPAKGTKGIPTKDVYKRIMVIRKQMLLQLSDIACGNYGWARRFAIKKIVKLWIKVTQLETGNWKDIPNPEDYYDVFERELRERVNFADLNTIKLKIIKEIVDKQRDRLVRLGLRLVYADQKGVDKDFETALSIILATIKNENLWGHSVRSHFL